MPYNLCFLEGEKTTAYEVCEQLNWTLPDRMLVPMGSGGHLSMIWKGINELYHVGFLRERAVRLVGTQAEGCAPIVETFDRGSDEIAPANNISTLALDISVKKPICGKMALEAIRKSEGMAISVSDKAIVEAVGLLAKLEGLERGPAGNTSLAAAIPLARELDRDQILVVQETEYTAAGKLPSSQLTFAEENGIEVRRGDPKDNVPGRVIVIPERIEQIQVEELDLDEVRQSYVRHAIKATGVRQLKEEDILFMAEDSRSSVESIRKTLNSLGIETPA